MKGFVLFVAVVLGVLVSNVTFGQESLQPTPVVIDGSIAPAPSAPSTPSVTNVTAPAIATTESCCCKQQQTLVGMSRHAVQRTVARGRCVAQQTVSHGRQFVRTVWSKRPHLRRCKCC